MELSNLLILLGIATLAASILPFIKTHRWWIRGFDYPKPQVFLLSAVVLILWLALGPVHSWFYSVLALALAVALAWNAFLILPFTPIWRKQVADAKDRDPADSVSILMSNVLMENDDFDAVAEMIRVHDPDIVMLAETDQRWADAMAPIVAEYPHVASEPLSNHYGMIFMTRLNAEALEMRHLVKADMPSIRADLGTPSGRAFRFYGMHPEPPHVGNHSDLRDAELMVLAKELNGREEAIIVGGDLNDVAWSHTTRKFKRLAGLLDPRIGRGLYSSFHADYWFARWPLDHLFHGTHFELIELRLLKSVGSDHFPVLVKLSFAGNADRNDPPDPEKNGDQEEAEALIEHGLKNA